VTDPGAVEVSPVGRVDAVVAGVLVSELESKVLVTSKRLGASDIVKPELVPDCSVTMVVVVADVDTLWDTVASVVSAAVEPL
jgi:hypothetical protein